MPKFEKLAPFFRTLPCKNIFMFKQACISLSVTVLIIVLFGAVFFVVKNKSAPEITLFSEEDAKEIYLEEGGLVEIDNTYYEGSEDYYIDISNEITEGSDQIIRSKATKTYSTLNIIISIECDFLKGEGFTKCNKYYEPNFNKEVGEDGKFEKNRSPTFSPEKIIEEFKELKLILKGDML